MSTQFVIETIDALAKGKRQYVSYTRGPSALLITVRLIFSSPKVYSYYQF
jgi:hypothetical protein